METKTIRQSITLNASSFEAYELLMDSKKHSAITGGNVNMNKKPKGKFTIFDGYIHGYNIELIKGEKIIQAWHFMEEGWPEDHFSICNFQFKAIGNNTKLTLLQTDVPEHKVEELKEGWKQYYWKPMKKYLKTHNP